MTSLLKGFMKGLLFTYGQTTFHHMLISKNIYLFSLRFTSGRGHNNVLLDYFSTNSLSGSSKKFLYHKLESRPILVNMQIINY